MVTMGLDGYQYHEKKEAPLPDPNDPLKRLFGALMYKGNEVTDDKGNPVSRLDNAIAWSSMSPKILNSVGDVVYEKTPGSLDELNKTREDFRGLMLDIKNTKSFTSEKKQAVAKGFKQVSVALNTYYGAKEGKSEVAKLLEYYDVLKGLYEKSGNGIDEKEAFELYKLKESTIPLAYSFDAMVINDMILAIGELSDVLSEEQLNEIKALGEAELSGFSTWKSVSYDNLQSLDVPQVSQLMEANQREIGDFQLRKNELFAETVFKNQELLRECSFSQLENILSGLDGVQVAADTSGLESRLAIGDIDLGVYLDVEIRRDALDGELTKEEMESLGFKGKASRDEVYEAIKQRYGPTGEERVDHSLEQLDQKVGTQGEGLLGRYKDRYETLLAEYNVSVKTLFETYAKKGEKPSGREVKNLREPVSVAFKQYKKLDEFYARVFERYYDQHLKSIGSLGAGNRASSLSDRLAEFAYKDYKKEFYEKLAAGEFALQGDVTPLSFDIWKETAEKHRQIVVNTIKNAEGEEMEELGGRYSQPYENMRDFYKQWHKALDKVSAYQFGYDEQNMRFNRDFQAFKSAQTNGLNFAEVRVGDQTIKVTEGYLKSTYSLTDQQIEDLLSSDEISLPKQGEFYTKLGELIRESTYHEVIWKVFFPDDRGGTSPKRNRYFSGGTTVRQVAKMARKNDQWQKKKCRRRITGTN